MHDAHKKPTLQKRTAAFLYVCAGVLILTVPHLLSAAGAGIVSCTGLDCQFCSVAQLIQNVINFLIQLSIPLSAALFAYAGFLYATAGVSGKSDQINKARGIFSKVGGGFIFTLIGWLVINTFLSTLLGGGPYANGKWFEIPCVNNRNIAGSSIATLLNGLVAGTPDTSGSVGGITGVTNAQCASTNDPPCGAAYLQSVDFTDTEAAAMSCIAVTENSGQSAGCTGNACGAFQIMLTQNKLEGEACAKYNNGNTTLDCPSLCKGTNGAATKTYACKPCVLASQDAQCNAESAQNLYANEGYTPWLGGGEGSSDNAKAVGCVNKYDPTSDSLSSNNNP